MTYARASRFREVFDADNRIIAGEPSIARVLGVPRFLFRELMSEAGGWLRASVRRDEGSAFASREPAAPDNQLHADITSPPNPPREVEG